MQVIFSLAAAAFHLHRRQPPYSALWVAAFLPLPGWTHEAVDSTPVFVVHEFREWGVSGTVFVLYASGFAIYSSHATQGMSVADLYKTPTALERQILEELSINAAPECSRKFDLDNGQSIDRHETTVWTPGMEVRIFGDWDKLGEEKLPKRLLSSLRRVDLLRKLRGTPWHPSEFFIWFTDYSHAVDESVSWPEGWPDLESKNTLVRGEEIRNVNYRVTLPGSLYAQFRELQANRPLRAAILMNGRKMGIGAVELPLPGQEEWLPLFED